VEEVTGPEPVGPSKFMAPLSSSAPVTCSLVVQQNTFYKTFRTQGKKYDLAVCISKFFIF